MSIPVNGPEVGSFPLMHKIGIPRAPWGSDAFTVARTRNR